MIQYLNRRCRNWVARNNTWSAISLVRRLRRVGVSVLRNLSLGIEFSYSRINSCWNLSVGGYCIEWKFNEIAGQFRLRYKFLYEVSCWAFSTLWTVDDIPRPKILSKLANQHFLEGTFCPRIALNVFYNFSLVTKNFFLLGFCLAGVFLAGTFSCWDEPLKINCSSREMEEQISVQKL